MDTEGPGEFGRRLRQLRESAALSQEELAERANLTAKAIGALERGERRRPYPNTVRALCAALDLDGETARTLADAVRPERPKASAPTPQGSIPIPQSPMVGRARQLADLADLLALPTTAIVTLTGPGGVGKTRLALEVAHRLRSDGREVVIVELAAVRRVDLVVPMIARAVGLQAGSEDPIGAIHGVLADRTPVIVLDNLEHLVGAAGAIADLVTRCPGVVVLATSRAPLRVRAEHEVPLDPLEIPSADGDVGAIADSPAAQMFADRARAVAPDFVVDERNAEAVADICRRVDGLPLALELVAAHLRYLAPEQVLDRLGHVVGSARLRDLPERQQTIRATLDWSHALLTSDEQEVLGCLSAFAGGFDLVAAEEVAGAPERDVLSALEGLVEQSLVVFPGAASGGAPRHRLLECVRDYAAASMTVDEAAVVADRHASCFAGLCDRARVGIRSDDLPSWLDRLALEHANLRAALTTLVDRGDLGTAARMGSDTWLYWALRGHAGEGLIWWRRVLEEAKGALLDDRGRAASHLTLAGLELATGDVVGVCTDGAAAVAAARAAGDTDLLAEALVLAGTGAAFSGDLETAAANLDEVQQALVDSDDAWTRAHHLVASAQVALLNGDLDACRRGLDAAEELAREQAGQFTLGLVLNMRTSLELAVDDDAAALRSAVEATQLAADVGTTWTLVYTLSALAVLAQRSGLPALAAELFAAGDATAEVTLVELAFRPDLESAQLHLAQVRGQLDAEEFERCWERGRTLRVEDLGSLVDQLSHRIEPS